MTTTRREFLGQSGSLAGGAWLMLQGSALAALAACAREAAQTGAAFETLTEAEARVLRAFAARVIPSDDLPGAEEAGAIYFIDKSLGSFFSSFLAPIQAGIADLNAKAAESGAASFADLDTDAQIQVLQASETAPWFGLGRLLVVLGTFSDPKHGGNMNEVGWKLVGRDHLPSYQPPFGYYDARAATGAGGTAGGEAP